VGTDALWKMLREERFNLQRQHSWCISTDSQFASKVADIAGLYLNPPLNAVVVCVDEKLSIQALERKTGHILTDNGKTVRALKTLINVMKHPICLPRLMLLLDGFKDRLRKPKSESISNPLWTWLFQNTARNKECMW
jgi:hypothetical protein